ncbi:hypothetical protein TRE132_50840 [Pseudomonas chlororaphis subsp. aurantiaca]|nr:hypothetical protein TRE132_50840 [Pseudomonas chlororaphis subsp. aurantiaca]
MHHRIDIAAQVAHQVGIAQVTLDELGPAPHQMLHTFGPTPVDPYIQALLKGKTREASANEAACAGDQNFHDLLRLLSCFMPVALCIA